jgi:hypothetical protein
MHYRQGINNTLHSRTEQLIAGAKSTIFTINFSSERVCFSQSAFFTSTKIPVSEKGGKCMKNCSANTGTNE